MMLYCYPKFVRSSGLGNRLFPWARSVLFAERYKARSLPPRWVSLRRGPLLRGGSLSGGVPVAHVTGKLLLIGNFTPPTLAEQVLRARILARARIVSEDAFDPTVLAEGGQGRDTVVQFEQYGAMFADVKGQSELLLRRLREVVRPGIRLAVDASDVPPIVLNVRGASDFKPARSASELIARGGVQTPLSWFRAVLQRLRDMSGADVPAIVVSDVSDAALAELLSMKNVRRCKTRYALEDLAHARPREGHHRLRRQLVYGLGRVSGASSRHNRSGPEPHMVQSRCSERWLRRSVERRCHRDASCGAHRPCNPGRTKVSFLSEPGATPQSIMAGRDKMI